MTTTDHVVLIGEGKVGRGLFSAAKQQNLPIHLMGAHRFLESDPNGVLNLPEVGINLPLTFAGALIVITARDNAIAAVAAHLAKRVDLGAACVVHCAGALDTTVLDSVRPRVAGVAQMHPMISFADPDHPPTLQGGHAHVAGDPAAEARAYQFCRAIGLVPRTFTNLDRVAYHAAAGLVANGAAALAAAGRDLLIAAGAKPENVSAMLGPLLRSVAENIEVLGLPAALTGPVRRGDAKAVAKHLDTLRAKAPHLVSLYLACAHAQLPLARTLGDASTAQYDEIDAVLRQKYDTPQILA